MNIAYVRVSSADPNNAEQRVALEQHNIDKWYTSMPEDRQRWDTVWSTLVEEASKGDTIYIFSFSKIDGKLEDIDKTLRQLRHRGIFFVSIFEQIDSRTREGRQQLQTIFNLQRAFREKKKEQIAEWRAENPRIYANQGRKKTVNYEFHIWYDKYEKKEITKKEWAKQMGVSRPTLDRMIKDYEAGTYWPQRDHEPPRMLSSYKLAREHYRR